MRPAKPNIYFGYTLQDIEARFDGEEYIFTCDDKGNTVVKSFEDYDDTYEQIIKNVVIGSGVILICATVSIVGTSAAPTAVTAIFAASAKTGTAFALSSSVISGAMTAVVTGVETKNVNETVKDAALAASDGFKWGAISGVITGGTEKAISVVKEARRIPTPAESEKYVLQKYGGEEQISYLNGEKYKGKILDSTRPDVVRTNADGTIEAIEVKNYNLDSQNNRTSMYRTLKKQVTDRIEHLPDGSTQRIVLVCRNRKYSKEFLDGVVYNIQRQLENVYPRIPVDVLA